MIRFLALDLHLKQVNIKVNQVFKIAKNVMRMFTHLKHIAKVKLSLCFYF